MAEGDTQRFDKASREKLVRMTASQFRALVRRLKLDESQFNMEQATLADRVDKMEDQLTVEGQWAAFRGLFRTEGSGAQGEGEVLPPIFLPYLSLDALFIGREVVMERLHESLGGKARATAIVNAVHGLGGVGKTRLAVEYAWRYFEEYSAVLFLAADTPTALSASLAEMCKVEVLDLPEQEATEQAAQVKAVWRWLKAHPGWLLILDNVDTREAAEAGPATPTWTSLRAWTSRPSARSARCAGGFR